MHSSKHAPLSKPLLPAAFAPLPPSPAAAAPAARVTGLAVATIDAMTFTQTQAILADYKAALDRLAPFLFGGEGLLDQFCVRPNDWLRATPELIRACAKLELAGRLATDTFKESAVVLLYRQVAPLHTFVPPTIIEGLLDNCSIHNPIIEPTFIAWTLREELELLDEFCDEVVELSKQYPPLDKTEDFVRQVYIACNLSYSRDAARDFEEVILAYA